MSHWNYRRTFWEVSNELGIDVLWKDRETGSRSCIVRFIVFRVRLVAGSCSIPAPPTNGSRLRGFYTVKHPVCIPLGAQFIDYTNNKEIVERTRCRRAARNGSAFCDKVPLLSTSFRSYSLRTKIILRYYSFLRVNHSHFFETIGSRILEIEI